MLNQLKRKIKDKRVFSKPKMLSYQIKQLNVRSLDLKITKFINLTLNGQIAN